MNRMIVVDDADWPDLLRDAEEHGVEARRITRRLVEPVTATVAVVLIGSAIAVSLVHRLGEERKGGQVIDLRPGASTPIYRTKDLHFGLIVILTGDGGLRIELHDPRTSFDVLTERLVQIVALVASGAPPPAPEVRSQLLELLGPHDVMNAIAE